MSYLLGIDNGGTFSKCGIYNLKGRQITVASTQIPVINPNPGFSERNMEQIWDSNLDCIKKVLIEANINISEVSGISLSGHGKGLYMIDEQGNPVYHGIMSTDTRAWKYIKKWQEDGTADKVFEKTFQSISVSQHVALLAWFKDHKPEVLKKCRWILSIKDYIRYKLIGEVYGEYTDFSGSNLINLNTNQYDKELLGLFGLEDVYEKLPLLKFSTEQCGTITEEVAKETGLKKNVVVAGGMFDIDACGLALGMVNDNELCMIAGTWSINEYISKSPIKDKSISYNSIYCMKDYYLIEESSPTSAGNLEWAIQNFLPSDESKDITYKKINEMVSKISPKDSQIVFLPFLNGSNEHPRARGSFIGITEYHHTGHIFRAIFEGVVFSHMSHVEKLLKNRETPVRIRLAGGAAQSEEWVQIFADTFQIPIDIIEDVELGCLGAAISAGIAIGVFKDFEEASKQMISIGSTIIPNKQNKDIYIKKYQTYKKIISSLNEIWDVL